MAKIIVFRFKGGPRDGDESRSDKESSIGVRNEVSAYWSFSNAGTIGARVPVLAPAARDNAQAQSKSGQKPDTVVLHRYDVARKEETATEIIVSCEYQYEFSDPKQGEWKQGDG